MSPKRLPDSTTSNCFGLVASSSAQASTYWCSRVTPGCRAPTSVTTSRQRREVSSTFALSTDVTRDRRTAALSKATSAMRSISGREYRMVLNADWPSSATPRGSP